MNINRRAALISAALSTAALAFPAGSLVRAKEPVTAQSLTHSLRAAVEASGASWVAWLGDQLSHELAATLDGTFDASISPAIDGEPVVWLHANDPQSMMERHCRAVVRLAGRVA